jgi:hypothetical protein
VGALYRALAAGLTAAKNPEQASENEYMALCAMPGLDIVGDSYAVGMHYAKLAGIITVALRSAFTGRWTAFEPSDTENPVLGAETWRSSLYYAGNGLLRRIVLVERWSDDRYMAELRSWRTIGELITCGRNRIALTAVSIGASRNGRRHIPWTRCFLHPKGAEYRFQRRGGAGDFGPNWKVRWREDSGISTADWMTAMKRDGCMAELVRSVEIPSPPKKSQYLQQIQYMAADIADWRQRKNGIPPMRLAGCSPTGGTICPFVGVCHGSGGPLPEQHGFVRRISPAPLYRPHVPQSGDSFGIASSR